MKNFSPEVWAEVSRELYEFLQLHYATSFRYALVVDFEKWGRLFLGSKTTQLLIEIQNFQYNSLYNFISNIDFLF